MTATDGLKVLAGDIGGTKTILQVLETQNDRLISLVDLRYQSQQFDTFERLLRRFLDESETDPEHIVTACLGVAGPVTKTGARTVSRVTNLPWKLDSAEIEKLFSFRQFSLINDFQAVGYAVEILNESDFCVLQQGVEEKKATKAVIGAGTGLGHATLVWDESIRHYRIIPSEAGHTSFAPTTQRERAILEYLAGTNDVVSLEHVVSGPGISRIYQYLNQEKSRKPGEIKLSASDSVDTTPGIVNLAVSENDPIASEALDIFINAYGAAAGNLALTVLARGGLYIAGGIAPKIVDKMRDGIFMNAFVNKSKMKSLLETIPVRLITSDNVGLRGAARYALMSRSE